MSGDAERKRQAAVAMLEAGPACQHVLGLIYLQLSCAWQSLHKNGWNLVKKFAGESFPVFNLSPKKRTGADRDFEMLPLEPQLQPWIAAALEGLQGGVRHRSSEMVLYLANMTCQGIMSAPKIQFLVQALQTAAANHPHAFVGVVILPDRGADPRKWLGALSV